AVRDVLLERIMDAVELLLGHSNLLGWNLRQAHTHKRGRGRRPALILRPRLRPTDRSDEHESASERGAENSAIHCRLLPRPVLAPAYERTARESCLLCCASLLARSGNGRAAWDDRNPKRRLITHGPGEMLWLAPLGCAGRDKQLRDLLGVHVFLNGSVARRAEALEDK